MKPHQRLMARWDALNGPGKDYSSVSPTGEQKIQFQMVRNFSGKDPHKARNLRIEREWLSGSGWAR